MMRPSNGGFDRIQTIGGFAGEVRLTREESMAAKKKKKASGDLIISKTRTKNAVKKCNVGAEFYGALDEAVRGLIRDAEARAIGNKRKTLKAVFYAADRELVFVAIRGDLEVNETKLRNALGGADLRLMADKEVEAAGLVAGSAGPAGLKEAAQRPLRSVADESVPTSPNLVGGANKPDTHVRNLNYERDWTADIVADITLVGEGDPCPECDGALSMRRGIEVGHVFKLGTVYTEKLGANFLDKDGAKNPAVMGCYGIGLDRLLASIVEANHDERGIIWPAEVAPFAVHLVALQPDRPEVRDEAERIYTELTDGGIDVLYDDRDQSPGAKFADADLMGMPLRVTVSPRTLEKDSVELKRRSESEQTLVPLADAVAKVRDGVR